MMDDTSGIGGYSSNEDDLIEIDLNFESMRRFQGEFSPNLSRDGLFIDTGEPLSPGSVVRFRVILPEEFIFLEGTAVVEWVRGAEAVSDGAPGMALRFVTLSPQNQELVEQLVQDHIDAGGTAFDFNVRPAPVDFPTDSLEGAPPVASDTLDEGYRLTVRRSGPSVQVEALKALADATAELRKKTGDDEALRREEEHGFAILSRTSVALVEEELAKRRSQAEQTSADAVETEALDELETSVDVEIVESDEVEAVGEPPALDWSAEMESAAEPAEKPVNVALDFGDAAVEGETASNEDRVEIDFESGESIETIEPEAIEPEEEDFPSAVVAQEIQATAGDDELFEGAEPSGDYREFTENEPEGEFEAEPESAMGPQPDDLPMPADFDSGPEIIEDVPIVGLGGPAFDVSLPEADDEPDTTPVLPDEGRDEVTVHTDEDEDHGPPRRRRLWLFGLAAIVLLAIAGAFLWPRLNAWNENRASATGEEPVIATGNEAAELPAAVLEDVAGADTVESAGPSEESISESSGEQAALEPGEAGSSADVVPTPAIAPEPEREPASTAPEVALAKADSLISIEVDPSSRGTVIRIRGNGSLEDGALSMEPLTSPPRVLVRVRGIRNDFRPYTIESSTPEVTRVRSGLHEERRPPEMWIVVDLAAAEVAVGGVDIRQDVAEIILSRP